MEEYSTLSRSLTNEISKTDKKTHGIYFTPPSCVNRNLKLLLETCVEKSDIYILEPSCGSGEYISALHKVFPNANITAIENNVKIYDSVKKLENEKVTIYNMDYLEYSTKVQYDYIVGNPPYVVMKKSSIDKGYYPYFDGRPNMFILFLVKSFGLLKDNGIISFILPKGFLNCLYYDKTRKYIDKHFQILHIIDCKDDKYIETQQDTILLIIKKTKTDGPKKDNINSTFVLYKNEYTIFTDEVTHAKLEELYTNSKSLWELGFKASVGNVVWNQCKDILTDDESKTRLIYSSDIMENSLSIKKYTNPDKKNFIDKEGSISPILIINRGYGVGEYSFRYCLVDEQQKYLVENHLICIESKTSLSREDLISALKKIVLSFNDERTVDFIKRYFGNNAINITELNHLLPIYQDI